MFIIPSRGRPHNLQQLAIAWTVTGAEAPVFVLLDNDDAHKYEQCNLPRNWNVHISHPKKCLERIQDVYELTRGAKWYGFMGDDAYPHTRHWDRELIEAAGDWGIAYPKDGIQNEAMATQPVIGGKLIEALGWMVLPGLKQLYFDTVWTEIGKQLNALRYRDDVYVEHLHYTAGKSPRDATYEHPYYENDKATFEAWQVNRMAEDIKKIRKQFHLLIQ